MYRYWKPFEAYTVERVLTEHTNSVIDFGAGHSVYEDPALFARVQNALQSCPNVILLLPSPDLDESVATLIARGRPLVSDGVDYHEHFTKHPSNHQLATFVVYTKDKSPEQTRDEIIAGLRSE